jgi:hypothetical protein
MNTARLSARVDRLSARMGSPEAHYRVDLNLLTGAEADRLVALGYAYVAGTTSADEAEELRGLLACSLTLTSDGGFPSPFFVPRSLERYWRLQTVATSGFILPGGNYRFNGLCFADRERLMDLSQRYGWEPEEDSVCIVPLAEWEQDDVEGLCRLLWQATSEQERSMWERRDGSRRTRSE